MEDKNNPIKKSIDALLNEDDLSSLQNTSNNLPAFNSVGSAVDYDEMKVAATNDSKKLMNSLLKFYLSNELIQKSDYIQAKAKIDMMTQAGLIKQLQVSERSIDTLMRLIDTGEMTPRMFEVLGGLQKTMLDIMKHQTLHMMAAEENMKKLKRDIDIYQDAPSKTIEVQADKTTTRGTRNLMREIQAELNPDQIEETDFDSENQTEI
tara:strand:+ start:15096 stop:15716 length:621 start_codon:yes stop_codon:yes gene_type:complete